MDAGDVGKTSALMRIIAGDFEFEIMTQAEWKFEEGDDLSLWKLDIVVRKALFELCKIFKEFDHIEVRVEAV